MTAEIKEYKTTKESCQQTIAMNGCICSRCGGDLTPIETVDNSGDPTFWQGCEKCQVFNYGVKPDIYEIAKHMVDEDHYVHYSHMDHPSTRTDEGYKEYWRCSQIDGATGIIRKIFRIQKLLSNDKNQ